MQRGFGLVVHGSEVEGMFNPPTMKGVMAMYLRRALLGDGLSRLPQQDQKVTSAQVIQRLVQVLRGAWMGLAVALPAPYCQ